MSKFERIIRRFTNRRLMPLNFKLTVAILIAAVISLGAFILCTVLENAVAQKMYLSDEAQARQLNAEYQSLENYVTKNHVAGTNSDALNEWIGDHAYTQLVVYDNKHDVFSAGYVVDTNDNSQKQEQSSTNILRNKEDAASSTDADRRIEAGKFKADLYNRIVRFDDKEYYVYIDVNREKRLYNFMNIFIILITAAVFLVTVLLYNGHMIRRISRLSDDVSRISEGDLKRQIHTGSSDEIGELARSVDTMRTTLIERMSNERAAWDANAQLITAMSHDIRTPLTSLIGYLDIIQGHKFESQEELDRYINSSREKAFQLKELSDKLFRYFLVFGNQEQQEKELETLDAGILFQQLLVEHVAETISYGYDVNLQYNVPEGYMVEVDISSVRRLFDNLFSNIMKYADRRFSIEIKADVIKDMVKLILSNHIQEEAKKVESTKIGVKTCKKICEDMHSVFRAMEEEKIYTTEILIPIQTAEEPKQSE